MRVHELCVWKPPAGDTRLEDHQYKATGLPSGFAGTRPAVAFTSTRPLTLIRRADPTDLSTEELATVE
jgi:hypothetical protein